MTWGYRKWPEVTSFDRKSLEVPVEIQKLAYTVHFASYKAVARGGGSDVTGNEVTWPQVIGSDTEVTSFDLISAGSGCRMPKTPVYSTFHFLQSCRSMEEAVTWQEMMSSDLRRPKVTRNWRKLTGSLLEVGVQGQKLAYTAHFTSFKAVAQSIRPSHHRKWRHATSGDRKLLGSDVISPEVTWKWL